MQIIGLTGGIASGKSSVAQMLRGKGVPVVDADQLAREAVAPGSTGLLEIVNQFGPEVLTASGELDRPRLGARVFSDAAARHRLNAIIHPQVAALAAEKAAACAAEGHPWMVYEVPLLFENGLEASMFATILVALPEKEQERRLMLRDQLSLEEAQQRIRAQMPLAEKTKRATHVLDNSGTRDASARQLRKIWCSLTGQDIDFVAPPQS